VFYTSNIGPSHGPDPRGGFFGEGGSLGDEHRGSTYVGSGGSSGGADVHNLSGASVGDLSKKSGAKKANLYAWLSLQQLSEVNINTQQLPEVNINTQQLSEVNINTQQLSEVNINTQ